MWMQALSVGALVGALAACSNGDRETAPSSGGTGGASDVCEQGSSISDRAHVCAVRKLGPTAGPVDVTASGPVLAAGNTFEQSPCAQTPYDPPGFWFEVADASGEVWVLGALFQGAVNPLKAGDSVSVKAARGGGGFVPTVASLTLRDGTGKLIAYAGEAGDTAALEPPDGIVVTQGPALCTKHDSCGDWSAYDLEVTAAGVTVRVGYADVAKVGPYRVTHGGCELQAPTEGGTTCPDWFVARAAVGIMPSLQ